MKALRQSINTTFWMHVSFFRFIFKHVLDEFEWNWWKIKSDAERSFISFQRHDGRLTTIEWRQSMFEIVCIEIWHKYIEKRKHTSEKIGLCFWRVRSPKTGQKSVFTNIFFSLFLTMILYLILKISRNIDVQTLLKLN